MEETVKSCKQEGNKYFALGDFEKAIESYTEAIELCKEETCSIVEILAPLYSNRSNCFLNLKMFKEASEDAEKCIYLNNSWCKGYVRLAAACFNLKRYDQFKDNIEKAKCNASSEEQIKEITKLYSTLNKQIRFKDKLEFSSFDNTNGIGKESVEVQSQVDWLMCQYIKPYEDDAFRSLSVYHGLPDNDSLSKDSAQNWINFGLKYGRGDSPELLDALINYVENDVKSTLVEKLNLIKKLII